jgi:hypothetical protein
MKRLLSHLLAATLLVVPFAVRAQATQLRPGLWEHGYTMASKSGQVEAAMKQMQQSMASLPPEQRKMMEDMMAKQGVGLGAGGNTVRICLSKEDVERDQPPQQAGCTQTAKRNGNVWQVAFQCKGPPPSSGEGQVTLVSPTAYAGNFTLRTVHEGKPEQMQMSQTGKWLGTDCGKLRPVTTGR